MKIKELSEASGYIAKNAKEAKDPRWSASLTVDVKTDTMRKQLGAFFPTSAPNDGQTQVKEAKENTMKNEQLNEGMGSVNVETHYDVSRIRKLAGLANSSTATGTPVVNEEVEGDISPEEAEALADQLQEQLETMSDALNAMEGLVQRYLPREYRYMEAYTFAHIKTSLGGHGYTDRMTRSIESLIEDLRNHEGYDDEEM